MILLFLYLFQVAHVFLGTVSGAAGESDFTLHDFVILFDLLQSAVQLIQLFLCLEHTLQLFVCFFLLAFVLSLQDFVLAFGFNSIALHDVVVVVGALEGSLHLCELVLHSVKLHTGLFT